MIWFLRLFPAYRGLLARIEALEGTNRGLEIENASTGAMYHTLLTEFREQSKRIVELTSQLVANTEKSADFVARMKYGRSIFGDTPDVVRDLEHQKPIEHSRPQAFDLVKQAEEAFRESMKQMAQANLPTPPPSN